MLFWGKDIPFLKSLGNEVRGWKTLWHSTDRELPNNFLLELGVCDEDAFPNIYRLLVITCTLYIDHKRRSWAVVFTDEMNEDLVWVNSVWRAIGFCFEDNKTLKLPVPKIQTVVLPVSGSNLLLKFHNNFTAEFWPPFSYGLLLQRFVAYLYITEDNTRNFSQKYQQFSLLEAILFEQWGPFKRQFSQKIFSINEIKLFPIVAEWYLLFFAKFLSHRVENKKSVIAQCSCINDGATLNKSLYCCFSLFKWTLNNLDPRSSSSENAYAGVAFPRAYARIRHK